jgi:TetR/AcrR family acrAB operon transcriptional repressor
MARRTKADALATRHQLLDAAECVFAEKGVSRTSLNDIALAAGASRGAIYWHFKNKADLFNAMMERTTLPMEQALQQVGHEPGQDPLAELRRSIADAMHRIAHDERTRRVFEVATLKVEYVDELMAVRARHRRVQADNVSQMERSLQAALVQRGLSLPLPVATLAQGLYALLVGLIHSWLLAPETFELEATAEASVQAYLSGWGLLPALAG